MSTPTPSSIPNSPAYRVGQRIRYTPPDAIHPLDVVDAIIDGISAAPDRLPRYHLKLSLATGGQEIAGVEETQIAPVDETREEGGHSL